MRWFGAFACAGMLVWAASCAVDPYLTCGDACLDATVDAINVDSNVNPDVQNGDGSTPIDAASDQGVADVQGGLDANCHAPDSSTPQFGCPAGCCPSYQNQNYACNGQGQCCKINGTSCGQGSSCCGTCNNGGGGNGQCAPSCVQTNGSCSQSSDCCLNAWCKNGSCAACTQQGSPCTSDYECCYNYACQSNGDGGKTCQGN